MTYINQLIFSPVKCNKMKGVFQIKIKRFNVIIF